MDIRSVLVELVDNKQLYASSGTLINNKFVLTTILIVPETFRNSCSPKDPGFHPINIKDEDSPTFTILTNNDSNTCITYQQAKIVALISSKDLKSSVSKYLLNWSFGEEDDVNNDDLSTFLVMAFDKLSANNLLSELYGLWMNSCHLVNWGITSRVYVRSTPFGNRNFLNSYSEGIISNTVGENCSLILTDCPTVIGSEGAPICLKTGERICKPIGMILSSFNWTKGEWLGLTLGATFRSILSECFPQKSIPAPVQERQLLLDVVRKNVVAVKQASSWASGILIDKDQGVFLTNAHVVEDSEDVFVVSKDTNLRMSVVFAVPPGQGFDLAILKCATTKDVQKLRSTDLCAIEVDRGVLDVGDEVYAAGNPIFPPGLKTDVTITSGNISRLHDTMIVTTCSVLPGCSGGALLTPEGRLIGVITCNAKFNITEACFPRISMVIPVHGFWRIIEQFLATKDASHLRDLVVPNGKNFWSHLQSKI